MTEDKPPEGYEYVWIPTAVVDGGHRWVLLSEPDQSRLCRGDVGCEKHPVAKLNRSRRPGVEQWWFYCGDHLYGRRINNGVLETRIVQPASEEAA